MVASGGWSIEAAVVSAACKTGPRALQDMRRNCTWSPSRAFGPRPHFTVTQRAPVRWKCIRALCRDYHAAWFCSDRSPLGSFLSVCLARAARSGRFPRTWRRSRAMRARLLQSRSPRRAPMQMHPRARRELSMDRSGRAGRGAPRTRTVPPPQRQSAIWRAGTVPRAFRAPTVPEMRRPASSIQTRPRETSAFSACGIRTVAVQRPSVT